MTAALRAQSLRFDRILHAWDWCEENGYQMVTDCADGCEYIHRTLSMRAQVIRVPGATVTT